MSKKVIICTLLQDRSLAGATPIVQETFGLWHTAEGCASLTLNYFDAETKSPCTLQVGESRALLKRRGENELVLPFVPNGAPQAGKLATAVGTLDILVSTSQLITAYDETGGSITLHYAIGAKNWPPKSWMQYRLRVTFQVAGE